MRHDEADIDPFQTHSRTEMIDRQLQWSERHRNTFIFMELGRDMSGGSQGPHAGDSNSAGPYQYSHEGVTAQENQVGGSVPWALVELGAFCNCVFQLG